MCAPNDDHADAILRAVLETTDDMVCVVDAENHSLLTFNSAITRHFSTKFGKSLHVGTRLEEVFDAENAALWHGFFRKAIEEGPFSVAHRGLVPGQTLWLSFNRLVKDGRCFGVSFSGRDITPFERAINAARSAEDRFAKVFRHNPFPLLVTTAERGIILDANHAIATTLGRERVDLIGRRTEEVGLWANPSDRIRLHEEMRSKNRIVDFAVQYRHADGRLHQGMLAAEAINLDGVDCFLVAIADVTALRDAEQALRESELRYRALIENAPEAILLIDADTGRHVDANTKAIRDSGYDRKAFFELDYTTTELPPQPDGSSSRLALLERIARAANGEAMAFEWAHTRPDGQVVSCEVRMSPFPDPNRRLVWASIVNIEDRKRAEREATQLRAQLEQAQRLDSLGTLAGGIAHDFNNILCSIVGYAELALMQERDNDVRSFLEDIERGADRAKGLVRQILAFSRQAANEKKPVRVEEIVKEAVRLLRAALPATIVLNQHYESSGCVLTDPVQIHQVVMNLGTNAGLAMRDQGGTLDVVVTEREIDAHAADQHPGLKAGRHLSLIVKDTGCGIAPETLGRIFEPFFTTRPKGEGTGLGLSVAYGIVKEAGGIILVTSTLGAGSTFEVLLPLCSPATEEETTAITVKAGGRQRVLFVDDDPSIVQMAKISLGQFGYDVNAFTDPLQAIEEFNKRKTAFDVLVTDATMPKISGSVLAAALKGIRPDLPMILVSGAEDRLKQEEAFEAGFSACLSKPYRPTALARIIQDLCSPRPLTKHCS